MDAHAIQAERTERDRYMREHYDSPLPEEHIDSYEGLSYFAHDPAWRIPAEWMPSDPAKVPIPSTAGTDSAYTKVGTARCEIASETYALTVLDDGDGGSFIPFRDDTAGAETYAGGRYVPIEVEVDAAFIDFNRAYNAYCVYDEEFVCPLPPPENWIGDPIPAGEKMYP